MDNNDDDDDGGGNGDDGGCSKLLREIYLYIYNIYDVGKQ